MQNIAIYFAMLMVSNVIIGQNLVNKHWCYLALGVALSVFFLRAPRLELKTIISSSGKFETWFKWFLLFGLLTAFWGINPQQSIIHIIALFIVFIFIKHEFSKPRSFDNKRIIRPLFLVISGFVLLNVLAIFVTPSFVLNLNLKETAPHFLLGLTRVPNTNAGILLSCLIITILTLSINEKSLKMIGNKYIISSILIVTLGLILLSNSRSAIFTSLLLLIVAISIKPLQIINSPLKEKYLKSVFLFIFCLIIAVILIMLAFHFTIIRDYFLRWENKDINLLELNGRSGIWVHTVSSLFKGNWITGVGLSNQKVLLVANHYIYEKAHNSFVDVLLGTGVIGFILYSTAIVYSLIETFKNYINTRNTMHLMLLSSQVGLILHAMVESYLNSQLSTHYVLYLILYFLSASLVKKND